MAMYQQHHDLISDRQASAAAATTERRTWWAFTPGQVVAGVVALVMLVIAVLAITRAGIDSTLNKPVVNVAGLNQSAAVGIGELVLGLLLLGAAASAWNRSLMGFTGALMFIAGLVTAAASPQLLADMGTDHRSGWWMLIGGVIAMVAAAMPVFAGSSRRYRTEA